MVVIASAGRPRITAPISDFLLMRRKLAGGRAILTGASSGIGWELARELARRGVRLVLTARREDRLRELEQEVAALGGEAVWVPGDITDETLRRRLVETARDRFGGLDFLINNAGMGVFGPFQEAAPQRLRQTFEVNFFAAVELIRDALPPLKQGNRPIIVNVSSVLGHFGMAGKSEYCASKFALHGFSDSLRMELRKEGIDVLLVSPSTTATEFFDKAESDPRRRPRRGMSPAKVARGTARAMEKGKQEIVFSLAGAAGIWADRLFPRLLSRLLAR
jgi:short-subunit dehydrogenase